MKSGHGTCQCQLLANFSITPVPPCPTFPQPEMDDESCRLLTSVQNRTWHTTRNCLDFDLHLLNKLVFLHAESGRRMSGQDGPVFVSVCQSGAWRSRVVHRPGGLFRASVDIATCQVARFHQRVGCQRKWRINTHARLYTFEFDGQITCIYSIFKKRQLTSLDQVIHYQPLKSIIADSNRIESIRNLSKSAFIRNFSLFSLKNNFISPSEVRWQEIEYAIEGDFHLETIDSFRGSHQSSRPIPRTLCLPVQQFVGMRLQHGHNGSGTHCFLARSYQFKWSNSLIVVEQEWLWKNHHIVNDSSLLLCSRDGKKVIENTNNQLVEWWS